MLGLKPEPLLPWDGVLLVVDRLLEDPFDFSTELGIYRLIFDMQLAQCCMPIPRTQKGKPTMASQPWPASADINDREQSLACFMGVQDANEILGYLRDMVSEEDIMGSSSDSSSDTLPVGLSPSKRLRHSPTWEPGSAPYAQPLCDQDSEQEAPLKHNDET